uniref:Unannotated protein n=1 Tax=freshwater metagenome TaxID=449393 RepID=A0A6J6A122_9ZZZZ
MDQASKSSSITRDRDMSQLPRGRHSLTRAEVLGSQRGRMLRAVAVSVSEKGYKDTVVEDIVRGAGVSRKTFYEHFDDVHDCFQQGYSDFADVLIQEITDAFVAAEPTGLNQLRACFVAMFKFLSEEPELSRAYWLDAVAAGPECEATRQLIYSRFEQLFRMGWALLREREPDRPEPLEGSYVAANGVSAELQIQALLSSEPVDIEAAAEEALTFSVAVLVAEPLESD